MPEITQLCLLIAVLAVAVLNMTLRARKPHVEDVKPHQQPATVRLPMAPKAAQPLLAETPQPVPMEPEPVRASAGRHRADA